MEKKINILIVDDHEIFRQGLSFILTKISGFNVVGEAENGEVFLSVLSSIMPDIVLMDISMPKVDGVKATEEALKLYPDLKIICLSSFGDEAYYYKMIKAGVRAFVRKESGKDELEKAIRLVFCGSTYFPEHVLRNLVLREMPQEGNRFSSPNLKISKREKEILNLICQGYSNNEIAEKLFLSPKTVDNHRTNLLNKTSARNSANLVLFAIKNKLVNID